MEFGKNINWVLVLMLLSWVSLFFEPSFLLIFLSLIYAGVLLYRRKKVGGSWDEMYWEIAVGVFSYSIFIILHFIILSDVIPVLDVSFAQTMWILILGSFAGFTTFLFILWGVGLIRGKYVVFLIVMLVLSVAVINLSSNYFQAQNTMSSTLGVGHTSYPWSEVGIDFERGAATYHNGTLMINDTRFADEHVWVCDEQLRCQPSQYEGEEAASRFDHTSVAARYDDDGRHLYYAKSDERDFRIDAMLYGFPAKEALRFEHVPIRDIYNATWQDYFVYPPNIYFDEKVFETSMKKHAKRSVMSRYLEHKRLLKNSTRHTHLIDLGQTYIYNPNSSARSWHSTNYGREHGLSDLNWELAYLALEHQEDMYEDRIRIWQGVYEDVMMTINESDISPEDKLLEKAVITSAFVRSLNSQGQTSVYFVEAGEAQLCESLPNFGMREECKEYAKSVLESE